MNLGGRRVLLCSCEGSMPLDAAAMAKALGGQAPERIYSHLCRTQLEVYRSALASGEPLLVACGQEAPLFAEIAAQAGAEAPLCVDIRDRAGWSDQADRAAPKMAALLAEAVLPIQPTPSVTLNSSGSVLILGQGQEVLEAAQRLAADHPVTCLFLPGRDRDLTPPPVRGLGLFAGRALRASGHLGAFVVMVGDLAGASASARGALAFDPPSGQRELAADVVLDLSGAPSLLSERDGWIRVAATDRAGLEKALGQIQALVGEFEKPRWIKLDSALCAHSRNGQVGCRRCLDACPSGAIAPKGDAVQIDAHVCDGHGLCASLCPTGAIRFDVPADNGVFARMGAVLETYRGGGGTKPVLLIHESERGAELISALARFGAGLPASVLPLAVAAPTALGPDALLTALAKGAARIVVMADPARKVDLDPLRKAVALANRVASGLGWSAMVELVEERDPAALGALLRQAVPAAVEPAAEFLVMGSFRQTLSLALAHLHRHAPKPVERLELEPGDPFGAILVDSEKCTLCLACVGACPTKALSGHPDKPSLGLLEVNCVQCGLCRSTCPEKAVTLVARLDFTAAAKTRQVLKEEEAYPCLRCGKPFAAKSTVERMVERMSGHSMFAQPGRLDLIRMCEDCRVVAQYELEDKARPMAGKAPPVTRTTDDYLRERGPKEE